ncbi:MAG: hypothetical protein SGBAC_011459 [Bacillariaceae sp.]
MSVGVFLSLPFSDAFQGMEVGSSRQHFSTSTTRLFNSQKKKPRFSQQAYIQKKESISKSKPQQPWDSGKSIEDLESKLMARWGTLEDQHAPKFNDKKKNKQTAQSMSDLRAPVFDPWDEDEESRPLIVREYYDEDDEGFEYEELDDDEEFDISEIQFDDDDTEFSERASKAGSRKMTVGDLISPKPVGGKGTFQLDDEPSGFFFNPKAATDTKKQSEQAQVEEKKEEPKPKKQPKESAQAILGEDGKPLLLSVEEAMSRFESTVDEGVMDTLDATEESPIVALSTQKSWEDLGITSPILLENLEYINCPAPLDVQVKAVPAALTGNDVLVGTYTGSGKTLSFLTPLVQRLLWDDDNDPKTLGLAIIIIAPGRELASQIASVTRELIQDTGLTVQLAIGGTTFSRNLEQIRKRKPNIVVGTPGRIAELVVGKPGEKRGRLKVASLQSLVMDEFDALLEYKPHREPTRAIMNTLKMRHRDAMQSILCSATASDIMESSKVVDFLRPGFETAMADESDVLVSRKNKKSTMVSKTALHGVLHVPHRRFALENLRRVLHTEPTPQQILIFVENSRKVDIVVDRLENMGIVAAPLHGGMGSDKMDRAEVSKALREGYVGIVVATELAARGLDAPLLTHVINFDLATDASHYAHRAGRCGRGGRPGVVINFTTGPKERNVPQRFADSLGIEMHSVEARSGQLIMVDPETQKLDPERER